MKASGTKFCQLKSSVHRCSESVLVETPSCDFVRFVLIYIFLPPVQVPDRRLRLGQDEGLLRVAGKGSAAPGQPQASRDEKADALHFLLR